MKAGVLAASPKARNSEHPWSRDALPHRYVRSTVRARVTAQLFEGAQVMAHTRALMYVRTIHHAPFAPASFPSFRIIVSQVFIVSFRTYVAISWLKQSLPLRVRSGRAAFA